MYKHLNQTENKLDSLTEIERKGVETRHMGPNEASSIALPVGAMYDQTVRLAQASKQLNESIEAKLEVVESAELDHKPALINQEAGNIRNAEATVNQAAQSRNPRHKWLKVMHGFFMFYAQIMLLGAGIAFSTNNRAAFPYKRGDETDMLFGRCYGRDLRDPAGPAWLNDLACGYGLVCANSSDADVMLGPNPYLSAP